MRKLALKDAERDDIMVKEIFHTDNTNWINLTLLKPDWYGMRAKYQLCTIGECGEWTWMGNSPTMRLDPTVSFIEPWTQYTFRYRIDIECQLDLILPEIRAPLPAVTNVAVKDGVISWSFPNEKIGASFLVSHCFAESCRAYSVPADQQTLRLDNAHVFTASHIFVQAVKGIEEPLVSPSGELKYYAPKTEKMALRIENDTTGPEVFLSVLFEDDTEAPEVKEYHLDLCTFPIDVSGTSPTASRNCEKTASGNTTFVVARKPWTSYNVTVSACYGSFDSIAKASVTLPIYKKKPLPLSGLSWNGDSRSLTWSYEQTQLLTGFLVTICDPNSSESLESASCSTVVHEYRTAGTREYEDHSSSLLGGYEYRATVAPYIMYSNEFVFGKGSEISFTNPKWRLIEIP